jgi:predicted helicase
LAGEVKKNRPILVILGNPPYSGHSSNRGGWILRLIEDYKRLEGKPLGEKNPKWLQDDYVKFLRFAQWKIEQTGQGLVGMITNHSYLDNPTFRGMRRSLMETFDEIYVLDLHGNSLKRETCPDGSKDENVFDIRQGTAISLFIKQGAREKGRVYHADLWGLRKNKYHWLLRHDVGTTDWKEIHSKAEFYLFVPRDETALERYYDYVSVTDVFPVTSIGIQTHRDNFVIDRDREVLKRRIRMFLDSSLPNELVRQAFKLKDNRDWKMAQKRKKIQEDETWEEKIVRCLYRPFDTRWIFYHYHAIDFGREGVMRHMMWENIALNTVRQTKMSDWRHAVVSDLMTPAVYVEIKDGSNIFPLYLYPDTSKKDLFSGLEPFGARKPNLNQKVMRVLMDVYGEELSPEEIFCYVYAVLYAEAYREKYTDFLRLDFPRIPFTADFELFQSLANLGKYLADLHLLKSEELDPPVARFQGQGDNLVASTKSQGFRYNPKEERIYVNKSQYFEPVSQELWEYQIGGYQVLSKWIKDRRNRRLTLEEIKTYCRIVTALQKTIALQEEIDALYPEIEKETIKLTGRI